ncbi:MAG: undecaprenyl-diphosphate phosphatase [Trebonia sp.]
MRRSRDAISGGGVAAPVAAGPVAPGGPVFRPGGPGPEGYSQQPRQQQWQGPDPRYGPDGNAQYPGNGPQGRDEYGRPQYGQPPQYGPPRPGQEQHGHEQYGPPQYGQPPQYGPPRPGQEQYGQEQYGRDPRGGQPPQGWQPAADPRGGYDPRDPWSARGQQQQSARHGHAAPRGGHAAGRGPVQRGAEGGVAADPAVAADRRLSTMGYKRALIVGGAQILALMPGISRDGIVTVAGMWRGISRADAVRFSFLLSAPVILAAGALKAKDLTGPLSAGIHGPILVGSVIAGVGAYLSIRFLTKYFSEEKSLSPFGIYCLIAGLGSLAYLLLK